VSKQKIMIIRINILIILSIFLFNCNSNKRNTESQSLPEKNNERKPIIQTKTEINQDFSKSAELFAKYILKENLRTHIFDISESKNPKYIQIFNTEEIVQIKAYSNKNYLKDNEPKQYGDFTLFVATYNSTANAKKAFERITADTQHYDSSELKEIDTELYERVKSLNLGANHGGLITQNGKQVFSLVETCRETPMTGNWLEYEYIFTNSITNKDGDIKVLKAGCNEGKYYGGIRKASSQQRI